MKKSIITEFLSGTPSSTYSVSTGYSISSEWINTDNGNRFYHKTDGNWVQLDSVVSLTASAFYGTQSGVFRLKDGTQGSGYLLTSDTNGIASWTASPFTSLQTQINTKLSSATGTTNYLQKVNGVNSLGNSSILDDGSGHIGIGNIYALTRDITLGNQASREFGVEMSDSTNIGRDLTITAGQTINYALADFVLNNTPGISLTRFTINRTTLDVYALSNTGLYRKPANSDTFALYYASYYTSGLYVNYLNNDIWIIANAGFVTKQIGGSGSFVTYDTTGIPVNSGTVNGISVNPLTLDVWVIIGNPNTFTGKLYKQTGGTGSFVEYPNTPVFLGGKVVVNPLTNDVFIGDPGLYSSGKFYKQTGGTGSFTVLISSTTKDFDVDFTTGTVYAIAGYDSPANGIYKQTSGVGSFVLQSVSYSPGDTYNVNSGFNTLWIEPTTLNVTANFSQTTDRIYKQINYAAGLPNLQGGTLKLNAGTGKGTGNSNIDLYTGQKTTSGTDMQISTLRLRINNEGLMTLPSVTNTLITADATGKAVVTKEYLNSITSSLQTQLNAKLTSATGTTNYLQKVNGVNSLGNSSILDDGAGHIGIGTINAPSKDITFIGTKTIEIGLEDYSPILEGKDLMLSAGRAVNFAYAAFSKLNFGNGGANGYGGLHISPTTNVAYIVQRYSSLQTSTYPYTSMVDTGIGMGSAFAVYMTPQNNLYMTDYGNIYKRTNNTGAFVSQASLGSFYAKGITSTSNGDLYYCIEGGDIYKQTNQTGTPTALGQTTRSWTGLAADASDNIYACVNGGDVYKRVGTASFIAMGYTTRNYTCITITPIGDVYLGDASGNVWKQTLGAGAPTLFAAVGLGIVGITCDSYSNLYITIGSAVTGADVYFSLNSTTGTSDLQGGTLKLNAGTGKGTGDSNIDLYTGQKTTSGTDMQTSTLRLRINNEGLITLPSVTNALITADATGKAVVTKEYLSASLAPISVINIIIATTSNITTNTTDLSGYEQNGKNVMISNGVSAINLTCEVTSTSNFAASYTKLGSAAITFVAGVSASIVQVDGTLVLNGIAGSTACLTRTNDTYYLQISNR